MSVSRKVVYVLVISFVINFTKLLASDIDTVKAGKLPKHYFSKTIFLDYYAINRKTLDTINTVSKRLKSYQLGQLSLGFVLPVITKDIYNKDSTRIKNLHFFLTGGITSVKVDFGGISPHTFSKTYIGFRGIYNNGKKSIFFLEMAPFVTKDVGHRETRVLRLAATLLFNYSVTDRFSFRLGFTRSFILGNMFNLPYVGIRVGKLDKVNLSVQFPRNISLNIPMGKYVQTSLYTKVQGGFYTIANSDSLAIGNINDHKTLYFGRSEFLSGARIDIIPSRHFNIYLSSGITTRSSIEFFPTSKKANLVYLYNNYYREKIKAGLFINVGLVFKFGKTKSIYNNQQLYNAMDINNGHTPGDNNIKHANGEIPSGKQRMGKNKVDDVIDLIEAQDLY